MRFRFIPVFITAFLSCTTQADPKGLPTMEQIMGRMLAATKEGVFKDVEGIALPKPPPFPSLRDMPDSMVPLRPSPSDATKVKWVDLRQFDSPVRAQGN